MEVRYQYLEKVDSTNRIIKDAIDAGLPEVLVCRADIQTGGYGRSGRAWSSPKGGLYQSLLLRPKSPLPSWGTLGLVMALSIRRSVLSLASILRDQIYVKWPNDIMVADKKLVGISCEARKDALCIGTGVNVICPDHRPNVGGKNIPVFLSDYMKITSKNASDIIKELGMFIVTMFLKDYEVWEKKGFEAFLAEYEACNYLQDRDVQLVLANGDTLACGIVVGVDDQGRLLVNQNNEICAITSGEAHII